MNIKFQIISLIIVITLIQACSTPYHPSNNANINLTGNWESPEWGTMYLVQTDNKITGTYTHDQGQLEGTLQSNRIQFRWWELVAKGESYENARKGERGDGYFDVAADGKNISGEWRYDGNTNWSGKWTAIKR